MTIRLHADNGDITEFPDALSMLEALWDDEVIGEGGMRPSALPDDTWEEW